MEFEYLKRLAEVQERLGSFLDGLGLKAKLETSPFGMKIVFRSEDSSLASPAVVSLHKSGGWTQSVLQLAYFETTPMGNTGWTYDADWQSYEQRSLPSDPDQVAAKLKEGISDCILLKVGDSHPTHSSDPTFGRGFFAVEEVILDRDIEKISCSRIGGIEAFDFLDKRNRSWRIAFEQEKAVVYVDGEKIVEAPAKDPDMITSKVYDAFETVGSRELQR